MTRALLLAAALLAASPALAECPDPWPPQAATREQVRAALGIDPCGLDGAVPLPPSPEPRPEPSPAIGPMPALAQAGGSTYGVRSEATGEPATVRVYKPPPPRVVYQPYPVYRSYPVAQPYPVPYPVSRPYPVYQPYPVYRPVYRPTYQPYRPSYGGGYRGRRW